MLGRVNDLGHGSDWSGRIVAGSRASCQGYAVVALIHDADPQSEFYRNGDAGRVVVVNGALEQAGCVERAINEHEVDPSFTWERKL